MKNKTIKNSFNIVISDEILEDLSNLPKKPKKLTLDRAANYLDEMDKIVDRMKERE